MDRTLDEILTEINGRIEAGVSYTDNKFHTLAVLQTCDGKTWPMTRESADFNGAETTFGYDVFGRLTSMVRPGDSPEFPTAEFSYDLAQPFGDGVINYVETRLLDRTPGEAGSLKRDHYFISRKFVDGLGRARLLKREAEPDPNTGAPRVAVFDGTLFNGRSLKILGVQPFFTALPGADLDAIIVARVASETADTTSKK